MITDKRGFGFQDPTNCHECGIIEEQVEIACNDCGDVTQITFHYEDADFNEVKDIADQEAVDRRLGAMAAEATRRGWAMPWRPGYTPSVLKHYCPKCARRPALTYREALDNLTALTMLREVDAFVASVAIAMTFHIPREVVLEDLIAIQNRFPKERSA